MKRRAAKSVVELDKNTSTFYAFRATDVPFKGGSSETVVGTEDSYSCQLSAHGEMGTKPSSASISSLEGGGALISRGAESELPATNGSGVCGESSTRPSSVTITSLDRQFDHYDREAIPTLEIITIKNIHDCVVRIFF